MKGASHLAMMERKAQVMDARAAQTPKPDDFEKYLRQFTPKADE